MKGAIEWFARNTVAANLLMLVLLVGGAASALGAKLELFPEFSLDMVSVRVVLPGAAPEEVEESVVVPIEEAIQSVDGVKRLRSSASEGVGTVLVEVERGASVQEVLDDVETRVGALDTLPEEAEEPLIEDLLMRAQVIDVVVHGDVDERTLKRLGEEVRDELDALDEVSQVDLVAARPWEVSVEVSEEALRRHGLTFDAVADAIRRSSLDLSGGTVRTERGEIQLRTKGQAYVEEDFERLPLLTGPDGTRVLLGDVADVVDGFEDVDRRTRFDGEPAVIVQVFRVGDESALAVSRAVQDYVARKRAALPEGLGLEVWQDNARMLESRLDLMVRNGLQGLALVFLVLALFLRFRLSFWVTLGIPISFLGAMLVLPWIDVSVNMLSLFAFILVLGIVVDDAIIVGESVSTQHERGVRGVDGAIRGAHEVAVPVTFAILTSIVAFLPMLGIPGVFGKFFRVIPLAIIPTLLFSLVESKLILPAHLAHQSERLDRLSHRRPFRWWVAFQKRFAGGLQAFVQRAFRPFLEAALRWRYLTLAAAVATMLLAVGIVRGGFVQFVFFPDIEGDVLSASVRMPIGASSRATEAAVRRLEAGALRVREELEGEADGALFRGLVASVGSQPYAAQRAQSEGGAEGFSGSHLGEVTIELVPAEERELESAEVLRRWRAAVGEVPGAAEVAFDAALMASGSDVEIQLRGRGSAALRAAAGDLKREIARFDGVLEVADSFRGGRPELGIDVRPEAEALGISRLDLARQVRQAFYGEEAQRIQRGRDDVKVMVRYPEARRRSLHALETMRVRTPDGAEVPFATVAEVEPREGYASIERTDRMRTVTVTADLDTTVANPGEVQRALAAGALGRIAEEHGVQWSFEGESRDQRETMGAMGRLFLLALLGIYGLMAIPFRSYLQPAIVMTAIPFGLVGAVLGHLLMRVDFSVLSICGIAALAGVVVNDSLVLVDFVNRHRAGGRGVLDAARRAGVERFRPILLTSLTTFAGLTPLLLERSVQAQFLIPMAISLAFGVLFSTSISLVLVPSLYLIQEDLRRGVGGLLRRVYPLPPPVEAEGAGERP